jgi:DNA-binding transcriptional MerR regulator
MSVQATPTELGEIDVDLGDGAGAGGEPAKPRKSLTIGAVCKALAQEFPDISISKIRYLEDQKLLTPRRTAGGYRLYSQADVERLRTILRLQRDEFLPLRVIRQELAAGGEIDLGGDGERRGGGAVRRAILVNTSSAYLTLEQVVEETGAREELVAELENYGIVQPEKREGKTVYDETDREVIKAANELSRFGVGARNMRVFRTSADRESNLLEAVLGSSLRSRNPDRRKEALESLESLAATVSHLKHLLLIRDLRRLTGN